MDISKACNLPAGVTLYASESALLSDEIRESFWKLLF